MLVLLPPSNGEVCLDRRSAGKDGRDATAVVLQARVPLRERSPGVTARHVIADRVDRGLLGAIPRGTCAPICRGGLRWRRAAARSCILRIVIAE